MKKRKVDRLVVMETRDTLANLLAFEYGHEQRKAQTITFVQGARVLGEGVAAVVR